MDKVKIYSVEYLVNNELTDEDLKNLLDKHSLTISLIIHEFRIIGDVREDSHIIKEIQNNDNWVDSYFFNKRQQSKFIDDISKIYNNIYKHDILTCKRFAEYFSMMFGFKVR